MFKSFMIAAAALIVASPASAQSPLTEKNLSMALAKIIAETAVEQCQKDGFRVAVAVVDRGGHLKAFLRNDGPGGHTIEIARRKALTARMFNRTTIEFVKWTEAPALAGLREVADVISLGGGVPIRAGNELIGGIGVSGAPAAERDEACANAGIAKVADQLK
ncbi:MAG: heme-binding protein [Xanthobacteraceae bacterium]